MQQGNLSLFLLLHKSVILILAGTNDEKIRTKPTNQNQKQTKKTNSQQQKQSKTKQNKTTQTKKIPIGKSSLFYLFVTISLTSSVLIASTTSL